MWWPLPWAATLKSTSAMNDTVAADLEDFSEKKFLTSGISTGLEFTAWQRGWNSLEPVSLWGPWARDRKHVPNPATASERKNTQWRRSGLEAQFCRDPIPWLSASPLTWVSISPSVNWDHYVYPVCLTGLLSMDFLKFWLDAESKCVWWTVTCYANVKWRYLLDKRF